MKILMFNNEFPPLGGGTGTVNKELFKQFANHPSISIDLITSARGKQYEFEQFAENIRIFKYPVNNQDIHHSTNRELITYTWHALWASLKKARTEKYDLCMLWSGLPAGPIALMLKWFMKIPYIIRVGGVDIPGFSERYTWVYRFFTPLIKMQWRNAELTIGKCQQEVDMVRAVDLKPQLGIIENGIDATKFAPNWRDRLPNEPIKIVCVARLIPRKGIPVLIRAAQQLKEKGIPVWVNLVGSGDEEENYKALVQELGLEDTVHFAGFVDRSKINQYYAEADAFAMPSYNEGMSNSVLEAMAAGLPVLVTPTGGTDELVTHGENGFVFDFDDVNSLASYIQFLAEHPGRCEEMGRMARERAEQQDWRVIARTYEALFDELVGKKGIPNLKPV